MELVNAVPPDPLQRRVADEATRKRIEDIFQQATNEARWGGNALSLGYLGYALLQLSYPLLVNGGSDDQKLTLFGVSILFKVLSLYGFLTLAWSHLKTIETQAELSQVAERISALTYGIEHDLRQPVAEMKNLFNRKKNQFQSQDGVISFIKELEAITDRVLEVTHVVKLMRESPEEMARLFVQVNITNVAKNAIESVKNYYPNADIHTDIRKSPAQVLVRGNGAQLRRAFSNIFNNAVESTFLKQQHRKSAFVGCNIRSDKERSLVIVEIDDSGVGLPNEEVRNQMFDAYFSTKDTKRKNSGLGLYTATKIVEAHGGSLTVSKWKSGEDGVTLKVELPLFEKQENGSGSN